MRYRQLLAMLLSVVMVMTCFSVPVMADEIVEPVNTLEELDEAVIEESEGTSEEITEETTEETSDETTDELELVTIQEDASANKSSNLYYQVTSYEDLYNVIAEVNANAANTKNEQVVIDLNKLSGPSKL